MVIGAQVQDGLIEVHISGLQPSDLCQAGSSIRQENEQSRGNLTALEGRCHKVEVLIRDGKSIGVAAARPLDLDPLEYVTLFQVVLNDHMVHGRLDYSNGANDGVRCHTVQQVVPERVGISPSDVSKGCPLHPVLTQRDH